jgi:hypothetical protein
VTSKVSSAEPISSAVNDQIAPDDGMWGGDVGHYFGVGQSALHREAARRMHHGIQTYGLDPTAISDILDQYSGKDFAFCSSRGDQATLGIDSDYGISMTSPCWVFRQVERMQDMRLVSYTESGWDNHQDVVSLVRDR